MQGCIFSRKIKTFPELVFKRKKLFHSFREGLFVTFGKVFCNSQMEKLPQNLRFWKLFQDQKNPILENIHPWKYDHNYINARILGLEKSNYRPVFFNEKILASFFVEMFRGRETLFWLRMVWKNAMFFVVV